MYDTSNVGDSFRKTTIPLLGSWHIYKMATTCVWRLAAPDFLGPLFHLMFPNSKFLNNPRLVLASRILSLMRLAYPSFKPNLEAALARESKSGSPSQKPQIPLRMVHSKGIFLSFPVIH